MEKTSGHQHIFEHWGNPHRLGLKVATVQNIYLDCPHEELKELVADALRHYLKRRDISPKQIQLRREFIDHYRLAGPIGRTHEIDFFDDGSTIVVFEFSLSFYEVEQVYWVYDKAQLMKQNYPERQVKAFLTTDLIYPGLWEKCHELGVQLGDSKFKTRKEIENVD